MNHKSLLVASCLLLGFASAGFAEPAEAKARGVFGFKAYAHNDLKPFPKWRRVLDRYKDRPGECGNGQLNACAFKKWDELISELKEKPKKFQLAKVNSYLNLYRYILAGGDVARRVDQQTGVVDGVPVNFRQTD
ncbi:MAG: hypothetical protein JJ879_08225, partial [Sneathiella sp.]|nr:hypothetical protein [Sneathiella sp.]